MTNYIKEENITNDTYKFYSEISLQNQQLELDIKKIQCQINLNEMKAQNVNYLNKMFEYSVIALNENDSNLYHDKMYQTYKTNLVFLNEKNCYIFQHHTLSYDENVAISNIFKYKDVCSLNDTKLINDYSLDYRNIDKTKQHYPLFFMLFKQEKPNEMTYSFYYIAFDELCNISLNDTNLKAYCIFSYHTKNDTINDFNQALNNNINQYNSDLKSYKLTDRTISDFATYNHFNFHETKHTFNFQSIYNFNYHPKYQQGCFMFLNSIINLLLKQINNTYFTLSIKQDNYDIALILNFDVAKCYDKQTNTLSNKFYDLLKQYKNYKDMLDIIYYNSHINPKLLKYFKLNSFKEIDFENENIFIDDMKQTKFNNEVLKLKDLIFTLNKAE